MLARPASFSVCRNPDTGYSLLAMPKRTAEAQVKAPLALATRDAVPGPAAAQPRLATSLVSGRLTRRAIGGTLLPP